MADSDCDPGSFPETVSHTVLLVVEVQLPGVVTGSCEDTDDNCDGLNIGVFTCSTPTDGWSSSESCCACGGGSTPMTPATQLAEDRSITWNFGISNPCLGNTVTVSAPENAIAITVSPSEFDAGGTVTSESYDLSSYIS